MVSEYFQIASVGTGFSVLSNIFGDLQSSFQAFNFMTARLAVLFPGCISFPSVPYNERGSNILGGAALLRLRDSFPCLFFLVS